jgi:hypothetical protein
VKQARNFGTRAQFVLNEAEGQPGAVGRVHMKGPKLGIIKQVVKMKKARIMVFTPPASKACGTKRVGVTDVFTAPVTG